MVRDDAVTAPQRPTSLDLDLESDPAQIAAARKAVETFAAAAGFNANEIAAIGLCVNEVLANIIQHAYAGQPARPIRLSAECDASASGELRVRARDWGNGVNPDELPQPAYDPLTPGGVGLICLRELMDDVLYVPQPDGMLTTLVKRRPRRDGARA